MGWHMDLRIKWVLDGDKGKCRFMNLGYIYKLGLYNDGS